jgi:hypothetical protein
MRARLPPVKGLPHIEIHKAIFFHQDGSVREAYRAGTNYTLNSKLFTVMQWQYETFLKHSILQ